MSTFKEASQARVMLKMKLAQYCWYKSSHVMAIDDGYGVYVGVSHIDNSIRKVIPPVVEGVSVKTEVE